MVGLYVTIRVDITEATKYNALVEVNKMQI